MKHYTTDPAMRASHIAEHEANKYPPWEFFEQYFKLYWSILKELVS